MILAVTLLELWWMQREREREGEGGVGREVRGGEIIAVDHGSVRGQMLSGVGGDACLSTLYAVMIRCVGKVFTRCTVGRDFQMKSSPILQTNSSLLLLLHM